MKLKFVLLNNKFGGGSPDEFITHNKKVYIIRSSVLEKEFKRVWKSDIYSNKIVSSHEKINIETDNNPTYTLRLNDICPISSDSSPSSLKSSNVRSSFNEYIYVIKSSGLKSQLDKLVKENKIGISKDNIKIRIPSNPTDQFNFNNICGSHFLCHNLNDYLNYSEYFSIFKPEKPTDIKTILSPSKDIEHEQIIYNRFEKLQKLRHNYLFKDTYKELLLTNNIYRNSFYTNYGIQNFPLTLRVSVRFRPNYHNDGDTYKLNLDTDNIKLFIENKWLETHTKYNKDQNKEDAYNSLNIENGLYRAVNVFINGFVIPLFLSTIHPLDYINNFITNRELLFKDVNSIKFNDNIRTPTYFQLSHNFIKYLSSDNNHKYIFILGQYYQIFKIMQEKIDILTPDPELNPIQKFGDCINSIDVLQGIISEYLYRYSIVFMFTQPEYIIKYPENITTDEYKHLRDNLSESFTILDSNITLQNYIDYLGNIHGELLNNLNHIALDNAIKESHKTFIFSPTPT